MTYTPFAAALSAAALQPPAADTTLPPLRRPEAADAGAANDADDDAQADALEVVTPWLAHMLDQVDHGLLLLVDGSQVLHINHAAQQQLHARHPLQVVGGTLRVREAADLVALHTAVIAARQGQQRLVSMGRGESAVDVAVKPLGPLGLGGPPATLLLLSKPALCTPLAVQMYARSHGLTPTETRVFEALSRGLDPREVCAELGVDMTTVRTHLSAIRGKLGVDSVSKIVRRAAVLPPVVGVLKSMG